MSRHNLRAMGILHGGGGGRAVNASDGPCETTAWRIVMWSQWTDFLRLCISKFSIAKLSCTYYFPWPSVGYHTLFNLTSFPEIHRSTSSKFVLGVHLGAKLCEQGIKCHQSLCLCAHSLGLVNNLVTLCFQFWVQSWSNICCQTKSSTTRILSCAHTKNTEPSSQEERIRGAKFCLYLQCLYSNGGKSISLYCSNANSRHRVAEFKLIQKRVWVQTDGRWPSNPPSSRQYKNRMGSFLIRKSRLR